MPGWAIVAFVAIIMLTAVQVVSIVTGRSMSGGGDQQPQIEELKQRIAALESGVAPLEIEGGPHVPSKAEENMHAEDRWRLDMLETRLEDLEKKAGLDDDAG